MVFRAVGALLQTAEDTIGRNPCVRSTIHPTFTMLSSARFRACRDTQSFLNSKFGMPLAHLEIEKCRIERPRPCDGSHLVLTEWTYTRKSTHRMKHTRTSPAGHGGISDGRSSLGTTKSNFDFSFCESTFEVMFTKSAPDLPHPSVEHALTGIFLFSNEPMACQILSLKKIVCRQQL